ncbi:MAG TPA: zinc metalloprotease HtpX [Streptosporangiaceae bacterium]|jgi:heat shock protein HtpX
MARTRYATDRGLIARMGVTMFLLGLVFTGFVIALYFVLFYYGNRNGNNGGSGSGIVVFSVLIGVAVAFGGYWWSDKIALRTARAQLVTPQQAPQLHGIIDRICALADMPKPRVAISPVDLPNAFATGRSSKVAVVCVTEGLMKRLNDDELEGVLAHEMSHVAHKDVAVMTIASFLGIIAALLVRFAFYGELFGGGGRGRGSNNNQNALPILLIVMLVGIVVYAVSFLLIRLLSRYRELSADRSGALLTGQPSALASALVKVSGDIARIPTRDLRQAEPLNAFYFAPALSGQKGQTSLSTLFSTHPPLEKRLKQLDKISKQLSS